MPRTIQQSLLRAATGGFAALLGVLASGCQREEIRSYRVPKEQLAAAPGADESAPAATPKIGWQVPDGWQSKPADGMRVGSFAVSDASGAVADVSVIPLPGDVGTVDSNINRWRGQVGLAPVSAEEAAKLGETLSILDSEVRLLDFAGTPTGKTKAERMLVATLSRGDTKWFFKMQGDDALVAARKNDFVGFLKSVRFQDDTPAATASAEPATPAPAAESGAWKMPAGWTEVSPGPMQQAKFSAGGKAEVTISIFPGQAGGLLMNVNRWRGQIGLGAIDDAALSSLSQQVDSPSGKITVVDLKSDDGSKRLIAAIAQRGSESWYFKLMGDAATVEKERAAFVKFSGDPR